MSQMIDLTGDDLETSDSINTNSSAKGGLHVHPGNNVEVRPPDPKVWKRDFLSCVRSPLFQAPFAYYEPGVSSCNPGLFVHGAGKIGLPLSTRDAEAIKDVCKERAVNTTPVTPSNAAWELRPEEFSLRNPKWPIAISNAMGKAAKGLHFPTQLTNLRADLRMLLLVEPGQTFVSPPREVSSPGLAGTLAVFLPSEHQGGNAIFSYEDKPKWQLETSKCSEFESSILAWLGDTTASLRQVSSGFRCVLLYDIFYVQGGLSASAGDIEALSGQLVNLIKAWANRGSRVVFPGPLIYMLDQSYASNCLDDLDGGDKALASTLKEICEAFNADIYLADIEKEEQGTYHEDEDEEDDEDDELDWTRHSKDYIRWKLEEREGREKSSDISRSSTPEFPEILDGSEKYQLQKLSWLDGTEIGEGLEIEIEEGNFIHLEFTGDPDDAEHDRADNNAINRYWRKALVLLPRYERAEFHIENGLMNAQEILEDDVQAYKEDTTWAEGRDDLINTTEFVTKLYKDWLRGRSIASAEFLPSSEDVWKLLLEALSLVEMQPSSILDGVDINLGTSQNHEIAKFIAVQLVQAVGFEEIKEKLTLGISRIPSFDTRYKFLRSFGTSCSQNEAMETWVEEQIKRSLRECGLVFKDYFTAAMGACSNYGADCLDIIGERLKNAKSLTIDWITSLLDAGLEGFIAKEAAIAIFRDLVSLFCPRINPDIIQRPRSGNAALLEAGRSMAEKYAKLIYQCFSTDSQQELGELVTAITAQAITKTKETVEVIYWPLLEISSSYLAECAAWTEDVDLQKLYRVIINLVMLPMPAPPAKALPKNWSKASRGCGCREVCMGLKQFLEDPNKKTEHFTLKAKQKSHLQSQFSYNSKPNEDELQMKVLSNGISFTKTNSQWKKADGAWRQACLEIASKIQRVAPEPVFRTLLGEEIFVLWKNLHEWGSTPTPTLPFERIVQPLQDITASQSNVSSSATQSGSSQKRKLPWEHSQESPGAKRAEITPLRATGIREEQIAMNWVKSWMGKQPRAVKTSKRHLQVYSMWQHKNFSCEDIAAMLRDPPLQVQTVKGYICDAIQEEPALPYDRERLKNMMKGMGYLEKFTKLSARLG